MENLRPHEDGEMCNVHTNVGTQMLSMVATYLYLSMAVWFNQDSLVNIILLAAVRNMYRATMDMAEDVAMHVQTSPNETMKFIEMPTGLCCHDTLTKNYLLC